MSDFSLSDLNALIEEGNVEAIKAYMEEHNLKVEGNKIVPKDKKEFETQYNYWDQRQTLRKLLLNSTYGAILNSHFRMFDQRIGQSVTLSGRNITRHMGSTINELITGEYKEDGDAIIYGDTDSSYFSAFAAFQNNPVTKEMFADFDFGNIEKVIELYDLIAEEVNQTFTDFLHKNYNVPKEMSVIQAGREIVASRALFITKKRYAALVTDLEGRRQDVDGKPGKVKAMGLDLKRSDTPEYMQEFLNKVLLNVLTNTSEKEVYNLIREYRQEFRKMKPWEMGIPKKVNSLTYYTERFNNMVGNVDEYMKLNSKLVQARTDAEAKMIKKDMDGLKKIPIPGHVRASINYNKLREMNNDRYSMPISDGSKTIVCRLKDNPLGMNSIAYPIDETNLPQWFTELPFDTEEMEMIVIDKKIRNLLGILEDTEGWDLKKTRNDSTFEDLFA